MATVEALARAIGARDQTLEASKTVSDTHVRRVQRLAVSLARRAGMSEDEVKGVEVAALLHDIGKLAVPEHILNKPGKLTPEERKLIQTHPAVGAEIIGAVDFGYPVAPLIASHHERWNGEGYPKGLRGDDIPLGSRILGIVDYFDALIADRPYHKATVRSRSAPDDQGRARRGARPEARGHVPGDPRGGNAAVSRRDGRRAAVRRHSTPGRHARCPRRRSSNVIENIARANTEMGFLYELTEAMGSRLSVSDTMAHAGVAALHARPGLVVGPLHLRRDRRHEPLRVRLGPRLRVAAAARGAGRRRRRRLSGAVGQAGPQRPPGRRLQGRAAARRRPQPPVDARLSPARARPDDRRARRVSRQRRATSPRRTKARSRRWRRRPPSSCTTRRRSRRCAPSR